MTENTGSLFEAFLNQHDRDAWAEVVRTITPLIHEVDRNATEIWFAFYPLDLARALDEAEDPEQLARELLLQGNYRLAGQIDSSHRFLYGHRFWPQIKAAVIELALSSQAPVSLDLATQIHSVAAHAARSLKVDESLTLGITAIAFMTLQQTGAKAFKASVGAVDVVGVARKSPDEIVQARAKDDGQGLFGFVRGQEKVYTITFDERDGKARFKLINTQHLTTAAACDKRDHASRDRRCMPGEGPIPIECRSGACGTCWVGVLGGAEKLSEVAALESRKIKEFGYVDSDEPGPLIRLACQAQAFGAVSIVIPPWNGVFGKFLARRRDRTAEAPAGPAT
ncbi:MAG TPA: 2Fe-2S iron-sulfur cluster-binding protein [Blastocatellia bacterium]|nr:2Fe-2S iron-sulfur cluster-binding protein [Blastocatellia bacterium]